MYHDVTHAPDTQDPTTPTDDATEEAAATEAKDVSNKKERVLHTRVPAVLERELKRFADNLRIPVSNLVRTILEDAVNMADAAGDKVESRLKDAVKQLENERERLKKKVKVDPIAGVYAFQTVTLAQPNTCAMCQCELPIGSRAHLGLMDPDPSGQPTPRLFVCDSCIPRPSP